MGLQLQKNFFFLSIISILICLLYFKNGDRGSMYTKNGFDSRSRPKENVAEISIRNLQPKLVGTGGFFNLPPPPTYEEDWRGRTCNLKELQNPEDFYSYMEHYSISCDRAVMVGGQRKTHPPHLVGQKWVCLSDAMNFIAGKCLVYSFGIDRDFTFDDEMDNKFKCEVHSFDPTIGRKDHQRSERITFYNLGLSNISDPFAPRLKVERYINILKKHGHLNSTIDYLKIDIEGYEINFFNDIFENYPNLLKNIKQIGVEVHPRKGVRTPDQLALWRNFQQLECFGFRPWFSEINPSYRNSFELNGKKRSCCYEVVWMRDVKW